MSQPLEPVARWLGSLLPERASTQTWMVLTFALFVGIAVFVVALYVTLVLRGETQAALQRSMRQQAERIAVQVERVPSAERQALARTLGAVTQLRLAVVAADTLAVPTLAGPGAGRTDDVPSYLTAQLAREGLDDAPQVRHGTLDAADGETRYATVLYRPESGLLVEVAQPEPPLLRLAERTQVVLLLGMTTALALALVGSWIAAYQITTPLKTISATAKRVAEGRLAGKIRIDTRAAEIDDLAQSLNRASDAFREKIDELERLTRLQSEFIGNVSHEVRNPIFAVSGYLEALSTPTLPDRLRKRYAEKGLTNLQRLSNLFDDLIEIARLEYREDMIRTETFDLGDLVGEVLDMLRPKAERKGLALEGDLPAFEVRADPSRIRQVLVNLLDNAVAYTDAGTVRCRLHRRLDKVRVEVADTGKGISEEHLERIFERFYRVDPDRSRKSGGTGLGLSIVKQIIQAHGEQIHVESAPGEGTRFWFELPYAKQRALAEA
jgi:signal transduction histidine kinase